MAEETNEFRPDICVIGAGAGGLAAAAAAAAMGVPVVLIETGRMGGQSLNSGSIPSKALLAAAERANVLRSAARFGVKSARTGIDFAAVSSHVRRSVEAVAPQNSAERFTGLGVRVIAGAARFKDPGTVAAAGAIVKARRFIIATGTLPIIPAIPGLAETQYLTPETIFDLADCPRHLIVIGAGRTGLELAQAFRRIGSEVTVIEAATPLRREDRECVAVVLDALADEGIKLRIGVQIAQIRRVPARVQVVLARADGAASSGEEMIEASHILVAAGRRPNTDGLDLEAAGVRHEPDRIVVDKRLRTTNKKIYAIGDVIGGPRFAHAAHHHAGLVVRNALFRHPVTLAPGTIPRVIFTDPELAHVGLREDEARAQAGAIRILRWPYRENDRAITAASTDGHIKVITNRRGDILGATIVGVQAAENIAVWALAVGQKLNIGVLAGVVLPYPTYAELGKRAAITYFMRGLTGAWVRRIIGWLRRLG
jgi:pyruvate/2-oxoglutarate dehydrogenase complex dihydrolipoamide dehydrogenase (E3) component